MSQEGFTEYLYCDEDRVNSYFEQVSNPVAYDKVPMWKAGLSLTGPSAQGTQTRPGRPFTLHERIHKIVSYLHTAKLIEYGRLQYPFASGRQFRIEPMSARRAVIRPRTDVPNFPGLRLWVSAKQDHVESNQASGEVGALFLLEDFRGDDANDGLSFSSYTWLAFLAQVVDTSEPLRKDLSSIVAGLGSQFASDPFDTLSHLGAVFGPERRVTALYRVRAACNAQEQDFAVTTIGYPIVVTAEGGLLEAVI